MLVEPKDVVDSELVEQSPDYQPLPFGRRIHGHLGCRSMDSSPLHPEDSLDKDQAVDLLSLCVTAINRLVSDMRKRGLIS